MDRTGTNRQVTLCLGPALNFGHTAYGVVSTNHIVDDNHNDGGDMCFSQFNIATKTLD